MLQLHYDHNVIDVKCFEINNSVPGKTCVSLLNPLKVTNLPRPQQLVQKSYCKLL